MLFKNDYLAAVGVTQATYTGNQLAAKRICEIYNSARRGKISHVLGSELWTSFFAPLIPQFSELPATQAHYDSFATNQMLQLASLLRQRQKGDFGLAHKMLNLFLKDHWALSTLTPHSETLLHLPLDHNLLSKLVTIPPPWATWTKVVVTHSTQEHVVGRYLEIESKFRIL